MAEQELIERETRERSLAGQSESYVLPIVEEMLVIGKETIVTGGVRVSTRVSERVETIDEPLRQEEVEVERIAIGRQVTETPQARQEGDFWIIPVLEEVLVIEKKIYLKEEIRVRRTAMEVSRPQQVTLRMEEVIIEEIIPDDASILI